MRFEHLDVHHNLLIDQVLDVMIPLTSNNSGGLGRSNRPWEGSPEGPMISIMEAVEAQLVPRYPKEICNGVRPVCGRGGCSSGCG